MVPLPASGLWIKQNEEVFIMKAKVFVWGKTIALVIALLGISFYAGRVLARPVTSGQAQVNIQTDGADIPNAPDASFTCPIINNIAAFNNRIHLRCSNSNGGILYYAYANDPAHATVANQILAVSNTAFALGSGVYVYYYTDSSLNPPGCNVNDCRGLSGVSIVP